MAQDRTKLRLHSTRLLQSLALPLTLASAILLSACSKNKPDSVLAPSNSPPPHGSLASAVAHASLVDVEALINRGSDVNEDVGTSHDHVTPLLIAVVSNKTQIAQLLLRKGANPNFTHLGYSAKDLAYFLERDEMATTLENR